MTPHFDEGSLDAKGFAFHRGLLSAADCAAIRDVYEVETFFRSHIHMARHGFGRGEYKYFRYPLPPVIMELRKALYAALVPTANRWVERLGDDRRYPARLEDFLAECHEAGQLRPTPLLLRYGASDYNCLHQDLYGAHQFPLQVIIGLNDPERDYSGGELMLVEQRPRQQSIGRVLALGLGDAVAIAVNHRPQAGARGWHRVTMRHGVSEVIAGARHTLGVIFHDAL